jgi:hypothetical protein
MKDEGSRMNKSKGQKDVRCFSRFSLLTFFLSTFHLTLPLTFFSLHPFSFILAFHSSLAFRAQSGSRPGGGTAQLGKQTLLLFILLLSSPLATGHSHLALPLGESLHGGDSQAQMFVGSGYSSLPSSSRANWYFLMEQLGDIPGSIPGGMTELVE